MKLFVTLLSGLTLLASCKRKAVNSNVERAAIGLERNQGSNGSCWVFSTVETLNSMLKRRAYLNHQYRRTHGLFTFGWDDNSLEMSDYVRIFQNNFHTTKRVQLYDPARIENFFRSNAVPQISVNGVLYAVFAKRLLDWESSLSSEGEKPFKFDSGTAEDVSYFLQNFLIMRDEVPDNEFLGLRASDTAKKVCANGKCDPMKIEDVFNRSNFRKRSVAEKQKFIETVVEDVAKIPAALRFKVENGRLVSRLIEKYQSAKGRAELDARRAKHGLDAGLAFTEINSKVVEPVFVAYLASLLAVNQPFPFIQYGGRIGQTDIAAHEMFAYDFKFDKGNFGFVVRNSWGDKKDWLFSRLMQEKDWSAVLPSQLLQTYFALQETRYESCDKIPQAERIVFAALHSIEKLEKVDFHSEILKRRLNHVRNCF